MTADLSPPDESASFLLFLADQLLGVWDESDLAPLHGECLGCWLGRALGAIVVGDPDDDDAPVTVYCGGAGQSGHHSHELTRLWASEHAEKWHNLSRRLARKGAECDCSTLAVVVQDTCIDVDEPCPRCEFGRCSRICCNSQAGRS